MKKTNQLLEDIKSAQKELSAWPQKILDTFVLEGRDPYLEKQERSVDTSKQQEKPLAKKAA